MQSSSNPADRAEVPQEIVSSVRPHNFTHTGAEVLILRRVGSNRAAYGGFIYPSGVGATVEPETWKKDSECGNGLHGWPWGFGIGEGSGFNLIDDIWLVLGAKPEDVCGELNGGMKCKCQHATIRFEGKFGDAMDFLRAGQHACIEAMARVTIPAGKDANVSSKDWDNLAASGNASNLAASGYASKLAASGYGSNLAASGNDSNLAASGYGSNLAASGKDCVCAIASDRGRVQVGERGAFALAYFTDADGWRFVTGKVGENGIKAGTWYRVVDGKLVEA
jgi:hypothetical protein